jgi:hypothetical protein
VFQEINDLAIKFTEQKTKGDVEYVETLNRNVSAVDEALISGMPVLKLSDVLETIEPTLDAEDGASQIMENVSKMEIMVTEKTTPMLNRTKRNDRATSIVGVPLPVDPAQGTGQRDRDIEAKTTKNISNVYGQTRRSARIQDAEGDMQEKAKARKALTQGISIPPIPPSCPDPPCALDLIAKTCGFSLGNDDSTRIANISLIQAKEDALVAIQNTRQKISLIAESSSGDVLRDMPVNVRSVMQHQKDSEALEMRDNIVPNLLTDDQG